MDTKTKISDKIEVVEFSESGYKASSFKPSAPQNVAPPKPVIVPWQKK